MIDDASISGLHRLISPHHMLVSYACRTDAFHPKTAMGSKLITLPTVVVDFTVGSDGQYNSMTLYSCMDVLGALPVTELIFATTE